MVSQEGLLAYDGPIFDGSKYFFLSSLMEGYLGSIGFDVWMSIVNGYIGSATAPLTKAKKKAYEDNATTRDIILHRLSSSMLVKVTHFQNNT